MLRAFVLAAALLACGQALAKADAIPDAMIGRWCYAGEYGEGAGLTYEPVTEADWEKCKQRDGYLTVNANGHIAHEANCRYVTIKRTGEKTAPHTKPLPSELVPVVRVRARCTFADVDKWFETITLSIGKGYLLMQFK